MRRAPLTAAAPFLLIAVLAGGVLLASVGSSRPEDDAETAGAARWWRGNTHTHTLWSDGDAAPEAVIDRYRELRYDFLVLSDHNRLQDRERWVRVGEGKKDRVRPKTLAALRERFGEDAVAVRETKDGKTEMRLRTLEQLREQFEGDGDFILIQGEEITDEFEKRPIHHNAINTTELLRPPGGESVREVMQRTIELVNAHAKKTGRPVLVHLNHPNFKWAITPDDVAHVLGERFFEVYNGHRSVHNEGDADHPSMEATWDHVLTLRLGPLGGEPLYGLATDDAHDVVSGDHSIPGRGWVMVRAEKLTPDAITAAMLRGDFYASTGVTLTSIESDETSLTVKIAPDDGVTYTTRFIGSRVGEGGITEAGVVLQESTGTEATYRFTGDELYVRATVLSDREHPRAYAEGDLETAWVQPVIPKAR